MKKNIRKIFITLTFLFIIIEIIYSKDVKKVKEIEFRGLKYLSKYEIIRKVRTKAALNGIIIDLDSLKRALSGLLFVDKYNIRERNGRLIITVIERKPVFVVVVLKGKKSIPFEMDGNCEIISKNNLHTDDLPFLFIKEEDILNSQFSGRVKNIFSILNRLKKSNSLIYSEISEIYLGDNYLKVLLNGRRTDFILKAEVNEFIKLRIIAGYLDRIGYYPVKINLSDNMIVVR